MALVNILLSEIMLNEFRLEGNISVQKPMASSLF